MVELILKKSSSPYDKSWLYIEHLDKFLEKKLFM